MLKPPRATAHPSEAALQTAVIKRITTAVDEGGFGGHVLNVHGGSAAQAGGHPDLLACLPVRIHSSGHMPVLVGRLVALELKQPGKKPTPRQYSQLRKWAAAGALAGWATTEADVVEFLNHAGDLGWVNPQPLRP